MKETVCLVSLGCPKNLVDSEVILGLLSKEGYLLTTDPLRAEVLIINTCSFIEEATKEAIETIIQLSRFKKEGRCRLLIVSGCLPQRYGKVLGKGIAGGRPLRWHRRISKPSQIAVSKTKAKEFSSQVHFSLR